MASKKSARPTSAKKPLASKPTSKKKAVAKKSQAKPAPKPAATKTKTKAGKSTGKKTTSSKISSTKKKVVAKKVESKKTKTAPKKSLLKSVSKPKANKPGTKKPVVHAKKSSGAKKIVKTTQAKKPKEKSPTASASSMRPLPKPKEQLLSPNERYNIGGLFACAMERRNDPDCSRLRAVLRHLDLTPQEKDNLIRLSEGFMIPKLFAENLAEPTVNLLLADLVKFGKKQGNYDKYWREEIQQIGFWLGVFPAQFQAIEHQVTR